MAMIDYGAVLFKNGEQVNDSMFMDMLDAVGWIDVPRKKYPDCDYVYEDGFSRCYDCPKVHTKTYHSEEFGDSILPDTDCHKNDLRSVIERVDANYFVYIGDEHLTVGVYKYSVVVLINKVIAARYWGARPFDEERTGWERMGTKFNVGGVDFRIKAILPGQVHSLSFNYNGDYYNVVYGYGIDPNMRIWNEVKNRYLGKRGARKVDNLFNRIKESKKFYE